MGHKWDISMHCHYTQHTAHYNMLPHSHSRHDIILHYITLYYISSDTMTLYTKVYPANHITRTAIQYKNTNSLVDKNYIPIHPSTHSIPYAIFRHSNLHFTKCQCQKRHTGQKVIHNCIIIFSA